MNVKEFISAIEEKRYPKRLFYSPFYLFRSEEQISERAIFIDYFESVDIDEDEGEDEVAISEIFGSFIYIDGNIHNMNTKDTCIPLKDLLDIYIH